MKLGTDFSGIGSPEMALKYLGINFESIFACEIDKYARQSFVQLHKPKKFYNDITTRNHKEVEQLDLYVAGFPCQAFSMAGKRKGFDEARGTLFFNVAEFIQINQPKVFVLENVKGLLNHDKGNTFQTIVDILSNGGGTQNGQISLDVFEDGLGYHIYWQVLNTKNYGIPQNRERIFIVGFKDFREFSFPKPMELKLRLKDMLQDNPKSFNLIDRFNSFDKIKYLDNKICGTITQHQSRSGITNGFKIQSYVSIKVDKKYYLSDKMTKFVLNTNFREARPISKKGISRCLKVGGDVPCFEVKRNTKKIRRLTPLECWRLQGFKDEDFFSVKDVSDTQLYKQAGNSITVNVLMELFKKIYANHNK